MEESGGILITYCNFKHVDVGSFVRFPTPPRSLLFLHGFEVGHGGGNQEKNSFIREKSRSLEVGDE